MNPLHTGTPSRIAATNPTAAPTVGSSQKNGYGPHWTPTTGAFEANVSRRCVHDTVVKLRHFGRSPPRVCSATSADCGSELDLEWRQRFCPPEGSGPRLRDRRSRTRCWYCAVQHRFGALPRLYVRTSTLEKERVDVPVAPDWWAFCSYGERPRIPRNRFVGATDAAICPLTGVARRPCPSRLGPYLLLARWSGTRARMRTSESTPTTSCVAGGGDRF